MPISNDEDNESSPEELLADHPDLLAHLNAHLSREGSSVWQTLLQNVDESDFSLIDWAESLVALDEWLDQKGLALSTMDRLGYISCAAKSVSNSSIMSHLPSLVHDFLEQYGCELAVKK